MSINPFFFVLLWSCFLTVSEAKETYIVDHVDPVVVDAQLKLSDLVLLTLENYPDYALIAAMYQESQALKERGSRWISGAPQLQTYYKDDFAGTGLGAYEFDGSIQVPVWNWGQRDAGLKLAVEAEQNTNNHLQAIKLKVAGLLREALWALKLEELRYDMAKKELELAEKLRATVKRRVELGDLPKADFLLADSAALQQKTDLIHQEAVVMHVRKTYYFLTQTQLIPAQIIESQSSVTEINDSHPALMAINATIAQKKSQLEWVKAQGSGQTTVMVGGVSERGSRLEPTINSIAFAVNVPFGGQAFLAPQVAAANRELIAAETEKGHLYRSLSAQLHEAEHEMEVEKAQLEIALQLQANAQELLKMSEISFSTGEINLTEFLIVQTQAHRAIKNAQESDLRLQRDIALYNQALGVMP